MDQSQFQLVLNKMMMALISVWALTKIIKPKPVIIKNKKQIIKSKIIHFILIMNNFLVRLLKLNFNHSLFLQEANKVNRQ